MTRAYALHLRALWLGAAEDIDNDPEVPLMSPENQADLALLRARYLEQVAQMDAELERLPA